MPLNDFFFGPTKSLRNRKALFWLGLSLLFSLFYSYLALREALADPYVIEDDARQHVFWMLRFVDSDLFPNDLIANYFQSVAPAGYAALYWLFAKLGVGPILASKLLPGILGLLATAYGYALALEIVPVPLVGFAASLLYNQNLCLQDGLFSATPRAFVPPLLLAFLYYFLRRSIWGVCISIVLLGTFYPSLVFVCCGLLVLSLIGWQGGRFRLATAKSEYLLVGVGLATAFCVLLPYAVTASEYGPVITLAQARELPEFGDGGRSSFFLDSAWDYWVNGSRSGLRIAAALMPPLAYLSLLFWIVPRKKENHQTSRYQIGFTRQAGIFPRLLLSSLVMFLVAHGLLFTLHLPSRYTQHTLRIIIIFSASVVLTFIWEWLLKRGAQSRLPIKLFCGLMAGLLAVMLVVYPHTVGRFISTGYRIGHEPSLYQFLQQQPKGTLIASLTAEADNLPTFARRSVLTSREYAIPYHLGYYQRFRQRVLDTIEAQYSNDAQTLQDFIETYGVTHWLIEDGSFEPEYISGNKWIRHHQPAADEAITSLGDHPVPVLATTQDVCSVFSGDRYTVLDSQCTLDQIAER
ncbi:MAG: hypothetical protein AAFY78_18485 [Cyanobacteria bacterium J06648_16]